MGLFETFAVPFSPGILRRQCSACRILWLPLIGILWEVYTGAGVRPRGALHWRGAAAAAARRHASAPAASPCQATVAACRCWCASVAPPNLVRTFHG